MKEIYLLGTPSATDALERKASKPYWASVLTFSRSLLLSSSALRVSVRSAIPQV